MIVMGIGQISASILECTSLSGIDIEIEHLVAGYGVCADCY